MIKEYGKAYKEKQQSLPCDQDIDPSAIHTCFSLVSLESVVYMECHGVLRVYEGCFKEVSTKFKGCFEEISGKGVSKRFKEVWWILWISLQGDSRGFQECWEKKFKGVLRKIEGCLSFFKGISRYLKEVQRVFQEDLTGALLKVKRYFKKVSRVLQQSLRNSNQFQKYFLECQGLFKESFKCVLRKFHSCLKEVSGMFQECFNEI